MAESVDKSAEEEVVPDNGEATGTPDLGEGGGKEGEGQAAPAEESGTEPTVEEGAQEEDETVTEDVWAEALKEADAGAGSTEPKAEAESTAPENVSPPVVDAKPADFAELKDRGTGALADIDMILDIPVNVSVELGRSVMIIKDILQLGQGSVVELEKMAGEPMEILVNGQLVARGEVVMVNEKFGVRLTDIISPSERVKRLA